MRWGGNKFGPKPLIKNWRVAPRKKNEPLDAIAPEAKP